MDIISIFLILRVASFFLLFVLFFAASFFIEFERQSQGLNGIIVSMRNTMALSSFYLLSQAILSGMRLATVAAPVLALVLFINLVLFIVMIISFIMLVYNLWKAE